VVRVQYRPAMLADVVDCVDVRGRTRDNAILATSPATASETRALACFTVVPAFRET
jgi:hypothetical protein